MATRPLLCSGAMHASLSAMPGWRNNLGTTTRDDQRDGSLCQACANASEAVIVGRESSGRGDRVAAVAAFRAATGLSAPQVRALLEAIVRDEV